MKVSLRFLFAFWLTVGLGGAAAFAASPNIEGTPVPTPPKPEFSTMKFLIGTWECSDMSSRRPGPFQTTEVYSMDPSGYWMLRESTIHTASWIPREVRSETEIHVGRRGEAMGAHHDRRPGWVLSFDCGDAGGVSHDLHIRHPDQSAGHRILRAGGFHEGERHKKDDDDVVYRNEWPRRKR